MKVLVTGGRDYANKDRVFKELDEIHAITPISLLVQGGALGADTLAKEWAKSREVSFKTVYADWKKHGRAAGPIRNSKMLKDYSPNLVVAFPGGRGTNDMIMKSKNAGVRVTIFKEYEIPT